MQQRMAQEQAKEDWLEKHDLLSGPNKRPGVRAAAPEPVLSNDAREITDEDPETQRRNEEIDRVFNPVVERFRRIELIKRRPAATTKGRKKTGLPPKKVKFSVDVPTPSDSSTETTRTKTTVLLSPTLQTTDHAMTTTSVTVAKTETPAERFGPHPALPRTDQDFEDAICTLKQMMRDWTQEYFYNRLSDAERQDFNLYRLAQGSPELMKHAAWVTAGGDLEKWKSHFVGHRSELVFAVLGKMLEVEVFGHTMFGATPGQLATLTSMDLALLNVDGGFAGSHRTSSRPIPPILLSPQPYPSQALTKPDPTPRLQTHARPLPHDQNPPRPRHRAPLLRRPSARAHDPLLRHDRAPRPTVRRQHPLDPDHHAPAFPRRLPSQHALSAVHACAGAGRQPAPLRPLGHRRPRRQDVARHAPRGDDLLRLGAGEGERV